MKLRRRLMKLALPALLAYFLDPDQGKARRAKLRTQVESLRGRIEGAKAKDDRQTAPYGMSAGSPAAGAATTADPDLIIADGSGNVVGTTPEGPTPTVPMAV